MILIPMGSSIKIYAVPIAINGTEKIKVLAETGPILYEAMI